MSILQTKVTRKGQTTIPAEIREAIDLQEGDLLLWSLSNGTINAIPAREVIRRTAGVFKDHAGNRTSDDLQELVALEKAIAEGVWTERQERLSGENDE